MGMSDKKIRSILDGYEKKLIEIRDAHQSGEKWFGYQQDPGTDKMEHIVGMIPKMRVFLVQGRREKAFRWLGFIQGVFYSIGIYTIEDMAEHNRPTKDDLREQHPDHSFRSYGCIECTKEDPTYEGSSWLSCKYTKEFQEAPGAEPVEEKN